MLSSCLDLDVLDALSCDGYASHNHSFKIMSSFVHLRKDNGNIYTLQITWYSVIYLHFLHRALAYAVIWPAELSTNAVKEEMSISKSVPLARSVDFTQLPRGQIIRIEVLRIQAFRRNAGSLIGSVMAACCGALLVLWLSSITKLFTSSVCADHERQGNIFQHGRILQDGLRAESEGARSISAVVHLLLQ